MKKINKFLMPVVMTVGILGTGINAQTLQNYTNMESASTDSIAFDYYKTSYQSIEDSLYKIKNGIANYTYGRSNANIDSLKQEFEKIKPEIKDYLLFKFKPNSDYAQSKEYYDTHLAFDQNIIKDMLNHADMSRKQSQELIAFAKTKQSRSLLETILPFLYTSKERNQELATLIDPQYRKPKVKKNMINKKDPAFLGNDRIVKSIQPAETKEKTDCEQLCRGFLEFNHFMDSLQYDLETSARNGDTKFRDKKQIFQYNINSYQKYLGMIDGKTCPKFDEKVEVFKKDGQGYVKSSDTINNMYIQALAQKPHPIVNVSTLYAKAQKPTVNMIDVYKKTETSTPTVKENLYAKVQKTSDSLNTQQSSDLYAKAQKQKPIPIISFSLPDYKNQ